MKTYFKDFSMNSLALTKGKELEEVIDCRQSRFESSTDFLEAYGKIKTCLDKVKQLLPWEEKLHINLSDAMVQLKCDCYRAAYRDGMTDLMVAITLNQLGITKVECICPEEFKEIGD